jgi:hypothetical protein
MFETLLPDFSFEYDLYRYWKDNAQSWYRNQLAELGLLGSVGWLAWSVMLGIFAWRARAEDERRNGLQQSDHRHLECRPRQLIHKPQQSDLVHAVANLGHGLA